MTIASKRAEPLTRGTFKVILGMLRHPAWHDELVDLLRRDLFRVGAHDEMHLHRRGGVDLIEQALKTTVPLAPVVPMTSFISRDNTSRSRSRESSVRKWRF